MHSAPSVVYPVGRCAFQARLLALLGLASGAVMLLYSFTLDLSSGLPSRWLPIAAGILGWLTWMACAFRSWVRSPQGTLHWRPVHGRGESQTGAWSWTDRPESESFSLTDVERVLDLQERVLLRFHMLGVGQRWVWVERRNLPARWADLRRALVASEA